MLDTLSQLKALAGDCADAPVWTLTDSQVVECLDTMHAAEQALAAAKLHLVTQIDTRGVPAAQHHRSLATWLRQHLRIGTHTATRLADLAHAVQARPDLDQALTTAAVNTEQAGVIADTLDHLPAEAGREVVDKAVSILIGWAAEFDPHGLRKLGHRVLAHVDPELADRIDAAALDREQARAHDGRSFTLSPLGDGRVRLTGYLDTEAAAIVNAALDPLCAPRATTAPRQPDPEGGAPAEGGAFIEGGAVGPDRRGAASQANAPTRDERTAAQRRADALVDICRLALHAGQLPANGGDRPQVNLTLDIDTLRTGVGVATLDTGQRLTATQARRLACDAQLLPAVLDGAGQLLDVGQTRRLITGALRRALVLRDRGCAFPGCDRPPRWCEGHHIKHWANGGPTSLDNAVLLCAHHHRLIHRSDWGVRLGPDGLPEFLPPAHLDPQRRSCRNIFHHRT